MLLALSVVLVFFFFLIFGLFKFYWFAFFGLFLVCVWFVKNIENPDKTSEINLKELKKTQQVSNSYGVCEELWYRRVKI